jgi:ribosomal protein L44E
MNSNSKVVEGFGQKNEKLFKKDDDIFALIDRKLKGLTEELGGDKGKKEVKKILENTKKISDLECAKCMMNMIEENKGLKSVDLDRLAEDDSSEYCLKCKNYTALSGSIKSMIDNL